LLVTGDCWAALVGCRGTWCGDNESAVGSWRAGKPKLAAEFEAISGALGIGVHQCRPRDPEAKGLVERVNGYFETSFLPGWTFTGPDDFNAQFVGWLVPANACQHRLDIDSECAVWRPSGDARS